MVESAVQQIVHGENFIRWIDPCRRGDPRGAPAELELQDISLIRSIR